MSERELRQIAIIVLLGVIAYAVVVGSAMMLWPTQWSRAFSLRST